MIVCVWHADSALEEVPAHILHSDRWKVERWGRWFYKEGILTLEARALVESLRLALFDGYRDSRVVSLCDNMSVVLSSARCRVPNYALLKQVRVFCSLCSPLV